jgi:hypothetical protein
VNDHKDEPNAFRRRTAKTTGQDENDQQDIILIAQDECGMCLNRLNPEGIKQAMENFKN